MVTPHGELIFNFFKALAQYQRALIRGRTQAGVNAARGQREGKRPRSIDAAQLATIQKALAGEMSNAAVCRTLGVNALPLIILWPEQLKNF
jgi:DNA invertase Pin-like site-specific DNA recombinase